VSDCVVNGCSLHYMYSWLRQWCCRWHTRIASRHSAFSRQKVCHWIHFLYCLIETPAPDNCFFKRFLPLPFADVLLTFLYEEPSAHCYTVSNDEQLGISHWVNVWRIFNIKSSSFGGGSSTFCCRMIVFVSPQMRSISIVHSVVEQAWHAHV